MAEQIALCFGAAFVTNALQLQRRFHALGGGHDAEAAGQSAYRPHDCQGLTLIADITDEIAVDLDSIERKVPQIAEGGVAGAKVRNAVSVISSSRRAASKPATASAVPTSFGRSGPRKWAAGKLTATLIAAGHAAASRQACCRANPPIGTIRPSSSAKGTNSDGGISPRCGWRQRIRARNRRFCRPQAGGSADRTARIRSVPALV